jgi:LmbE family N-acetylglucosaminyl deacetylase
LMMAGVDQLRNEVERLVERGVHDRDAMVRAESLLALVGAKKEDLERFQRGLDRSSDPKQLLDGLEKLLVDACEALLPEDASQALAVLGIAEETRGMGAADRYAAAGRLYPKRRRDKSGEVIEGIEGDSWRKGPKRQIVEKLSSQILKICDRRRPERPEGPPLQPPTPPVVKADHLETEPGDAPILHEAPDDHSGKVWRALFVGAHPDDIELGAGALVLRLIRKGWEVFLLVMTDEETSKEVRRQEATNGALELGVKSRVYFAGFPDGRLEVNSSTVRSIQELVANIGLDPDLIVTHAQDDSHNDHVRTKQIVEAAFRGKMILTFSVHTSGKPEKFSPRIFVDVDSKTNMVKQRALDAHQSQRIRLEKGIGGEQIQSVRGNARIAFERSWGNQSGLPQAEGFAIDPQVISGTEYTWVMSLSDSPFHILWTSLFRSDQAYVVSSPFVHQPSQIEEHSRDHEAKGLNVLREKFLSFLPKFELHEVYSNDQAAEEIFHRNDVIVLGGAVSNHLTRGELNRFQSVDWVIDCDMPGSEPVYLLRKSTRQRWFPITDRGNLVTDLAVLTVTENPYAQNKMIVGCAGVHGLGTGGLLRFLAEPLSSPRLYRRIVGRRAAINVPLKVSVADYRIEPLQRKIQSSPARSRRSSR